MGGHQGPDALVGQQAAREAGCDRARQVPAAVAGIGVDARTGNQNHSLVLDSELEQRRDHPDFGPGQGCLPVQQPWQQQPMLCRSSRVRQVIEVKM